MNAVNVALIYGFFCLNYTNLWVFLLKMAVIYVLPDLIISLLANATRYSKIFSNYGLFKRGTF